MCLHGLRLSHQQSLASLVRTLSLLAEACPVQSGAPVYPEPYEEAPTATLEHEVVLRT